MKKLTLAAVVASLALVVTGCGSGSTSSKDYPAQAITWIVPYGVGGNTDAISRTVAQSMSKTLNTDIIVENNPGGSGAVGSQKIQKAKPDGYTVGLFTTGTMTVTPLQNKLGYSYKDFSNIGLMLTQPVVLLTQPNSQYKDAESLFSAAKNAPATISVGVPGATTPQAFELKRLKELYGVEFTVVPFDSNAEIMNALRGGTIQAAALNASTETRKSVESKETRPLAIGEPERAEWIKDTPTLKELGYDKLVNSGTLIGLTAPGGLPDNIESKLEQSLESALKDKTVIDLLGKDNIGKQFVGSADLDAKLKESMQNYQTMIGQ